MSIPAFYLPAEEWGAQPVLMGEEAGHANVLRLRAGEEAILLDGRGRSAKCRIVSMGRTKVTLRMEEEWRMEAPKSKAIVALALSKAVRRGFFLEKAAELGAWGIWLWQARRSQGKLDEKLIKTCASQVRAGAKQCHNPWFPEIKMAKDAAALAQAASSVQWRLLPWEIKAGEAVIPEADLARPGETMFVIGPEGGITEEEAEIFRQHGFTQVSLGKRILRCETAATLCLGLHWWAAQQPEIAEPAAP